MRQCKGWSVCLWIVALFLAGGANAQTPSLEERVRRLEDAQKAEPNTLRAFWQDGLRLQTRDQEIALEIGGKLQNDWNFSFFSDAIEDAFGDPDNRIFIRRASLGSAYPSGVFPVSWLSNNEEDTPPSIPEDVGG